MRKRLLSILLLCALLAGSASAAQLPAEDAASPDVLSAGERITGAGIDVSQYLIKVLCLITSVKLKRASNNIS